MFNFSEFCKEKKCPHYTERKHSAGTWRYCELIGTSFYVVQRPENCPHLEEIDARAAYEKEKHDTWKKITKPAVKSTGEALENWAKRINDLKDLDKL